MLSEVLRQGLKKSSDQIHQSRLMIGYRKIPKYTHHILQHKNFEKNQHNISKQKTKLMNKNIYISKQSTFHNKEWEQGLFCNSDRFTMKKLEKMTPLFRKVVSIDKWKNKYPNGYHNSKNNEMLSLYGQLNQAQKRNKSLVIWKENNSTKSIQEKLLKVKRRYSNMKQFSKQQMLNKFKDNKINFRQTFNSFYCQTQRKDNGKDMRVKQNSTQNDWKIQRKKEWEERWEISNQYDNQQLYS